jgi:hypothetical protein
VQLGAGTRQALPGAPPLIQQAIGAGTAAEAAGRAEHGADEEAAAVTGHGRAPGGFAVGKGMSNERRRRAGQEDRR